MTNLDRIFKSRDITLPTKARLVKAMVFPVVMYGCESWTVKKAERRRNWYFWTVVLEKTLESPLDCKEIQPVHSKGDQSWVFFGRNDAKAETPVFLPPHAKSWLIGKDPDAGRDWGQEEKGMTEDEMAGMASLTRWSWVWVNSGGWWWTGRPGVLQFMVSQRVGHDWVTELNWILHWAYVPQLSYPFVCWWTSRLLPCPGYYKQCCDEHWGTCVSFDSGFLGVYDQQWHCWVIWQFYFQFFKESPHCSP